MGWWITLGILAAIAILPVSASIRYNEDGPQVRIIAGPIRIQVFPGKKEKEPKKEKKPEKKPKVKKQGPKAEPKPKKKGGSLKDFLPLVQVALDFLGEFPRKLRINRLELKLVMAGGDPADLAINYGRAWAALGNLWPKLEGLFVIRKRDVEVECDFTAEHTLITAWVDISITIGRIISLAVRYGIRALKEFMKIRKQSKGGATI